MEVKNISKYYGSKMAIEDISFCAKRGEIVGLVGHNGSGKTTTMSIITNCIAPSAGTVTIDGISANDDPKAFRAKIGYLPEIPPLYTDMTVGEQLRFACGLRGIPKSEVSKQIDLVCERLNISGTKGRLIRNLSKGYKQRVGFAQALIGEPPLIILDEPTVGLDPQQIIELRELIYSLKDEHTIIVSSHILSEIAATCDRVVILSSGHLAADSSINQLLTNADSQRGYILQADGKTEFLSSIIKKIPTVKSCVAELDADNNTQLKIFTEKNADIHRELFAALSAAACPIKLLTPIKISLEDIFLQLTHDERYGKIKGFEK